MYSLGKIGRYNGERAQVLSANPIVLLVGPEGSQRPVMLGSWDEFTVPPEYLFCRVYGGRNTSYSVPAASWESSMQHALAKDSARGISARAAYLLMGVIKARKDSVQGAVVDHMFIPAAQCRAVAEAENVS